MAKAVVYPLMPFNNISPDDDSVMSKNVAINTTDKVVLTVLTLVIIRKYN